MLVLATDVDVDGDGVWAWVGFGSGRRQCHQPKTKKWLGRCFGSSPKSRSVSVGFSSKKTETEKNREKKKRKIRSVSVVVFLEPNGKKAKCRFLVKKNRNIPTEIGFPFTTLGHG